MKVTKKKKKWYYHVIYMAYKDIHQARTFYSLTKSMSILLLYNQFIFILKSHVNNPVIKYSGKLNIK